MVFTFGEAGAIREKGTSRIANLIEELGGWPVTNGRSWVSELSPETVIGLIRAKLNMGMLLELWVGPDDKNSSNNIIQVIYSLIKAHSGIHYLPLFLRT